MATKNSCIHIRSELDKKFYGIAFIKTDKACLSLDAHLQLKSESVHNKYRFLIMVGDGEHYNGLPIRLRTRLKSKLHRSVFVELAYYKDGSGVVKQCHYYDRACKRLDAKVTSPMLTSCFFQYSHEGILNLIKHETCCDFTHMIVTDGIELESGVHHDAALRGMIGGITCSI